LADNARLTVRLASPPSKTFRPPVRIILDRTLRLASHLETLALFNTEATQRRLEAPIWMFCSHLTVSRYPERVSRLEAAGAIIYTVNTTFEGLCLEEIMATLWQNNLTSVWVEAGGSLAASLVKTSWIDDLYFVISPMIFSDPAAIPAFNNGLLKRLGDGHRYHLRAAEIMGQDALLTLRAFQH
ncbi:MAG: RibD family protein, partial [Vampirovibrionales bacterium]|nr:RibD family protein [Vampirovibrionales bacterium]